MAQDVSYDLAVLGAGSGGMAAAKRAREAGLSVVQFERGATGGTCVNRGCVPKKLLVHASRRGDALRDAANLGWSTGKLSFDWPTLRERVRTSVEELSRSQRDTLEEAGIVYVEGEARLIAPDRVRTGDGTEYRARHVIVATGSRPLVPDLPGHEHALVSDDLFGLEALPRRLAMIGGGYIAVEFGCLFHRLGVDVTIFESAGRLLDNFEEEIVERLQSRMEAEGVTVHTGTEAACIAKGSAEGDEGPYAIELEDGSRHAGFDAVALLIGRAPNTEDIGLEDIGVTLDEHGQISVDEHGRTAVANVFAIGDVARRLQLTPVAIASGHDAVDAILGRAVEPIVETRVPSAVFATPELGSVGLDEAEARERGLAVEVRRTEFEPLAEMLAERDATLLVKLVVERGSGTVLGLHLCGENAAEFAQLGALLIEAGATERDFHRTIGLHPTDAEEIVGLGEAARPVGETDGTG